MEIAYQVRRSARSKVARIVVSVGKVEVVAPLQMSAQQILRFVNTKAAWISAAIEKVAQKAQTSQTLAPATYQHGALIPYQGQVFPLILKPCNLKRIKVVFSAEFTVDYPLELAGITLSEAVKLALTAWMKKTTLCLVENHLQQHSPRFQLRPTQVRIKTQKSRWGSCSSRNAININWLLILAPPAILEYVVVHELCHIREKNHSPAFWQLVSQHMPDYRQHQHWLKQHGASIMRGL